jgi:hypothetical protein
LPTSADVGKRDTGAPKHGTAFYPGRRGFYNYENQNDYSQVSDSQLPTTADVGKRDTGAPKHGTAFYPGRRGFYDYENANDYAQTSGPVEEANQPKYPKYEYEGNNVGKRDPTAASHSPQYYPGTRKFYDHERFGDHAQTSDDQLPTTADVGKRDTGAPKHGTAFYPGRRGFYDYENQNDFAQIPSSDAVDTSGRPKYEYEGRNVG